MKFGILASEGSWYYRDLERAALLRGHACVRLDFERLVAHVKSSSAKIRLGADPTESSSVGSDRMPRMPSPSEASPSDQPESHSEAVLVRTMPPGSLEQVVYRMDVLARWQESGTLVINSPKSLECAVDKYLTTARLQEVGLPVPETIVCEREEDALEAFLQLGSDVVVKPLFGSEGRGIVRVSDPDLAHRTFRTLMRLDCVLYLQQFIDHGGYDVRILVLDGQVIGGMRRRSPDDFRTNVSRQAIAEPHIPTRHEMDLALRSAEATGAFIAGVDLLYDRGGNSYVIEVNAVPGWQAFSRVNGTDVAAKLIDSVASLGG